MCWLCTNTWHKNAISVCGLITEVHHWNSWCDTFQSLVSSLSVSGCNEKTVLPGKAIPMLLMRRKLYLLWVAQRTILWYAKCIKYTQISGNHTIKLNAYSTPSYHLNQCCAIANRTIRNKLQWLFNQNTKLFIHKKINLKLSYAECRPFCPGGDKLNEDSGNSNNSLHFSARKMPWLLPGNQQLWCWLHVYGTHASTRNDIKYLCRLSV